MPRDLELGKRILPDGRELTLVLMFYNLRLCIGVPGAMTYDDGWCFRHHGHAWRALEEWDGEGDPPGWFKHVGSQTYNAEQTSGPGLRTR